MHSFNFSILLSNALFIYFPVRYLIQLNKSVYTIYWFIFVLLVLNSKFRLLIINELLIINKARSPRAD